MSIFYCSYCPVLSDLISAAPVLELVLAQLLQYVELQQQSILGHAYISTCFRAMSITSTVNLVLEPQFAR